MMNCKNFLLEKTNSYSEDEKELLDYTDYKETIQISFTREVLPFIISLTCILTIKDNNKDFVRMLNDIKEDKNLLEIFDEQCLIWWNKKRFS